MSTRRKDIGNKGVKEKIGVNFNRPLFLNDLKDKIGFFVEDNLRNKRYSLSLSKLKTGDFNTGVKVNSSDNRIKIKFSSYNLKGNPRDIKYIIRVPLPENLYPWNLNWKIWSATRDYPRCLFDLPATYFVDYGCPDGASLIPCVVIYNPEEDIGLTMLNSLDVKTPKVQFIIKREERYIDTELSCFMLPEENEVNAEFNLYFHQGDWRCGLKMIYENYQNYFEPNNSSINEMFINLTQTGFEQKINHDKAYIENTLKTINRDVGINFSEIHHYMPQYGMYMPEGNTEEWVMDCFVHRGRKGVPVSLKAIHQHLKDLKSFNIKSLMYFQPVGDCEIRLAIEKFKDSIAKDNSGREYHGGIEGFTLCNSDKNTSFGKDIRRQLKQLLKEFENDADGIFWDNLCFGFFDYAHSDGISMVDGKPVYRLSFAYEQFKEELFTYLKERGKFVFGNGPYNIEVGKGIDCVMAEALTWLIEHFSYICIAKPLNVFYYAYTKDPKECEEAFQASLLWGAFPSCRIDVNTEEIHNLYLKYKKFFELLIGKKWVLEKEPIKLEIGWKGNIFENRKGYVAFVIKDMQGFTTKGSLKVFLRIRYHAKNNIKVIGISDNELNHKVKNSGDYLEFEIENPEFVNAIIIESK